MTPERKELWKELQGLRTELLTDDAERDASLARWAKWKPIVVEVLAMGRNPHKIHLTEEELPDFLARVQDSWCLRWEAVRDLEDEYPMMHEMWRKVLKAVGWKTEKIRDRHIYDAKMLQVKWTTDINNRVMRYNRTREVQDQWLERGLPPSDGHYAPMDTDRSSSKSQVKKRKSLFEFPVTAVIRWMGADGWEFDQARKVLTALEADVADGTIRAQLRGGMTGDRGEPAALSAKQERELYALL